MRVDEHGNLATLGKERQKLCDLWLKTRDFRTEIIQAHEEMERYRAEAERLYEELDVDEPKSE